MSDSGLDNSQPEYHPLYSAPDADLILLSSDGIKYRVHSIIMKLSSGMFRRLPEGALTSGEAMSMEEDSSILERMLAIIYPNGERPSIDSIELLVLLTSTTKKYDAPSVFAHIRREFIVNPVLRDQPLELYMLACENGWDEEAKVASKWALETDLRSSDALRVLEKLDSNSLLKLQALHRKRKDALDKAIEGCLRSDNIDATVPDSAMQLVHIRTPIESSWSSHRPHRVTDDELYGLMLHLRFHVLAEMDKCSAGNIFRTRDYWNQHIFDYLWKKTCVTEVSYKTKAICPELFLDKDATIKEFIRVLDLLPTTI